MPYPMQPPAKKYSPILWIVLSVVTLGILIAVGIAVAGAFFVVDTVKSEINSEVERQVVIDGETIFPEPSEDSLDKEMDKIFGTPNPDFQGDSPDSFLYEGPEAVKGVDQGPIAIGEKKQFTLAEKEGARYSVDFKAGTAVTIEVIPVKELSFADPRFWVINPAGETIGYKDDADTGTDPLFPSLRFTPPVDGTYVIQIADTFESKETLELSVHE